jgi:hypothetical protein
MRKESVLAFGLLALFLISISAPTLEAANETALVGKWTGALDAMGTKLRLILTVKKAGEGVEAILTSVDQGNVDLTVDEITLDEGKIAFKVNVVGGSYAGELKEGGSAMEGKWTQGGIGLPLVLTKEK